MRESYEEGVASRFGLESCVAAGNCGYEALTEVRAGWVLSRESTETDRGADAVLGCGRQHRSRRYCETWSGPAWSETPCMYGNSLRGSREIPRLASAGSAGVRVVNPKGTRRR